VKLSLIVGLLFYACSSKPVPPVATYDVRLTWTEASAGVTTYEIFRDGELVATIAAIATVAPTYTEVDVPVGSHTYDVKACEDSGSVCSPVSNLQTAVVP
jgi:3D (Asp-Asp-Asp) domain-containing protein